MDARTRTAAAAFLLEWRHSSSMMSARVVRHRRHWMLVGARAARADEDAVLNDDIADAMRYRARRDIASNDAAR